MTGIRTLVIILVWMTACSDGPEGEADAAGSELFVRISSLDEAELSGRWTSGDASDCSTHDFAIVRDSMTDRQGLAVKAEFNGWDQTGRLDNDATRITFIDPTKRLPVTLEDGGLRVRAPADGLAVVGSRNIFDDGVLFRKCAG